MKPIRTDSHQHALSVHVATDQGTYHVGIDDGLCHVAYADIRPTATGVDLALELAAGHHSPHRLVALSTRVRHRRDEDSPHIVCHLAAR